MDILSLKYMFLEILLKYNPSKAFFKISANFFKWYFKRQSEIFTFDVYLAGTKYTLRARLICIHTWLLGPKFQKYSVREPARSDLILPLL